MCLFETNQQHNLQHMKETDPNLSASPASSTFLLFATTNTAYAVIYHTLYETPPPHSCQAPLKSVNCQSTPALGNIPPLYWFFEKLPLKVGFSSEPPKH